jgi:Ala-tRNA(Pro) deacylase
MLTTREEILARLADLGIEATTVDHPPVFTVEQAREHTAHLPGGHCKNLFLKDKKGRLFLITAQHETRIDLKRVHEAIGASGRLSFGSAEQLRAVLGVEPGSVTALAVANDRAGEVTMILDANLEGFERVNVHPLVNTATTGLSWNDLLRFLRATGHEPQVVRLPEPAAQEAAE